VDGKGEGARGGSMLGRVAAGKRKPRLAPGFSVHFRNPPEGGTEAPTYPRRSLAQAGSGCPGSPCRRRLRCCRARFRFFTFATVGAAGAPSPSVVAATVANATAPGPAARRHGVPASRKQGGDRHRGTERLRVIAISSKVLDNGSKLEYKRQLAKRLHASRFPSLLPGRKREPPFFLRMLRRQSCLLK